MSLRGSLEVQVTNYKLLGLYEWTGPRVAEMGLGGLRRGGIAVEVGAVGVVGAVGLVEVAGLLVGLVVVVVGMGAGEVLAGMGSGKMGWQPLLD